MAVYLNTLFEYSIPLPNLVNDAGNLIYRKLLQLLNPCPLTRAVTLVNFSNSLKLTIVLFPLNAVPMELLKYSLYPLHHDPTRCLGIHLSGLD